MHTVTEIANAKINLFLDVTDRRPDGFHNIRSIMHSVSLADSLILSAERSGATCISLAVDGADLSADRDNLVYRAIEAYLSRTVISAKVTARLTKRIPIGAGLGGGSSDAAATLRAMNSIFRLLTVGELSELAARLGSDVPYCLGGGTALCEGRGELITPMTLPDKMHLVIAIGDDRTSTPTAYKALDELYHGFDGTVSTLGGEYYSRFTDSGDICDALYNVFEAVAPPSVASLKSRLISLGATSALMSGSGPSVFGIFQNALSAQKASDQLSAEGFSTFFAASI